MKDELTFISLGPRSNYLAQCAEIAIRCGVDYVTRPECFERMQAVLRSQATFGQAAIDVRTNRAVGFILYEMDGVIIKIVDLAVDPNQWRNRIGAQLVKRLTDKLGPARKLVLVHVAECNLAGQQFFRAMGFYCFTKVSDYFGNGVTAYVFRFPGRQPKRAIPLANRISARV